MTKPSNRIIQLEKFIEAARDSGYKNAASAIAELIDNSLEAGARRIHVNLSRSTDGDFSVVVSDDGRGMGPSTLRLALQFGGSTRFNSRRGSGRYGMGLPNSSLSQARRVEVFTWQNKDTVWWSYLDVDEIASGSVTMVPIPKRRRASRLFRGRRSKSGTTVVWSKCDRLEFKTESQFASSLRKPLAQMFRKPLSFGKRIYLCGRLLRSSDPLFMLDGDNLVGGSAFGPPLKYELTARDPAGRSQQTSIMVRFVELPIEKWYALSSDEKRKEGISMRAGVSILRAGREIDYGWFFMGSKRKENYDDWWRCEILFEPLLDELFGVTNTKQGIRPTKALKKIITPDIERIARELNSRVRKNYSEVKRKLGMSAAEAKASLKDYLLEPPKQLASEFKNLQQFRSEPRGARRNKVEKFVPGLRYRIEHKKMKENTFFLPLLAASELVVTINEDHPFYEFVYAPFVRSSDRTAKRLYKLLELVILAAARAECRQQFTTGGARHAKTMREEWSRNLAVFLE